MISRRAIRDKVAVWVFVPHPGVVSRSPERVFMPEISDEPWSRGRRRVSR